ncbi:MAG: rhomboid family intramembrane serine protease, partial [Anaerolineales bacterium]
IPTVGASGAIAAVLGSYLFLYPHSRVLTFIPLGFFMQLRLIPASIVLVVWFILQLFNGVLTFAGPELSDTAFWAHIGGFLFGLVITFLFFSRARTKRNPTW